MKRIAAPIFELSNICHSDKKGVVDRLSLSVPRGDCFAVVYRSSENIALLLDILSGKVTPKKGKVFFKGDDITGSKNHFGIVRQQPSLPRLKTVAEYAAAPIVKRGLSRSMADVLVYKEMNELGMAVLADRQLSKLSPDECSDALIFSAYMCSHEFMVLDEPFAQFGADAREVHMSKLKQLAQHSGMSLLIFTKDAFLATEHADYVMVADKNTASSGIFAVEERRRDRALEQINERLSAIFKQ